MTKHSSEAKEKAKGKEGTLFAAEEIQSDPSRGELSIPIKK